MRRLGCRHDDIRSIPDFRLIRAINARRKMRYRKFINYLLHGAVCHRLRVNLGDIGYRGATNISRSSIQHFNIAFGKRFEFFKRLRIYKQLQPRAPRRIQRVRRNFRFLAVAINSLWRFTHAHLVRLDPHLARPHEQVGERIVDHVALVVLDATGIALAGLRI